MINTYLKRVVIFLALLIQFLLAEKSGNPDKGKWCKKTTGSCFCDPNGEKRFPDITSLQGPPGPKGEPGNRGIPGQSGYPGPAGLKGERGNRGIPGESGYPGLPGLTGEQGDMGPPGSSGKDGVNGLAGLPGSNGLPGNPGVKGVKGDKGERGEKGQLGSAGPPGIKGDKGVQGYVGAPGSEGDIGKTGPKGAKGSSGPPGPIGLQGTCTCPRVTTEAIKGNGDKRKADDGPTISWVEDNEVPRACKYSKNALQDGEHKFSKDGLDDVTFTAHCKGTKTCLKPKVQNSTEISYKVSTPFMLSSFGFDPRYEIDKESLLSLQSLSVNAVQYIKIYCLNSYVYGDGVDNKTHSVSFVTWNDVMLRSYSTEDNPYFLYTVDQDGCKDATHEWGVTEFVLQTDKAERLPVTDILVRDARDQDQKLRIELGELCYD